jgi:hypothetical protein
VGTLVAEVGNLVEDKVVLHIVALLDSDAKGGDLLELDELLPEAGHYLAQC